jgi:hypothetical protein
VGEVWNFALNELKKTDRETIGGRAKVRCAGTVSKSALFKGQKMGKKKVDICLIRLFLPHQKGYGPFRKFFNHGYIQ